MKNLFRTFCFLLLINSFRAHAQEDTLVTHQSNNFYDLSLEELMNIKISVASVKELTPRESPGVVTLITEDDIKNMGARDLMDVLRVVPGFDFGVDVEGVIGIGVRGNWAHEGKILLLIDGQEMNENLYSSIQLGNHYPVSNVERIEIIRGPGSAVYGGCAEYAVINIVSKKAKELNGIRAASSYGQMSKTFGHKNMNISVGDEEKDFSYSFSAFFGQSNRSQDNYRDVFSSNYNLKDESEIHNSYINLGLNYKDYQFRAIIDNYNLFTRDAYQEILSKAYLINFDSYLFELKREYKINRKLSVTPRFNYKNQTPWAFESPTVQPEFEPFKINSQRYSGMLTVNYDYNNHINLLTGAEGFQDIASQKLGSLFNSNNSDKLIYENAALFVQTLFKTKFATITAGARYNLNSLFNASFVPRLGITKVLNGFHAKLLFSKAFRAPNTQNIDLATGIKPENTTVFEAEAGYELNEKMFITLNAYDISTNDPIIYYYDEIKNDDAYENFDKTGTRGIELEYKYKIKKGYLGLNYSFYSTKDKQVLANYAVPDNQDVLLAFPAHKINFIAGIKISEHIRLNSTVSFSGTRYGITAVRESSGDTVIKKFDSYVLTNLNLCYNNLFVKGLNASIGVYNALDKKDVYIQPYNNLHAPLPANTREFVLKISYDLKFKQ